MVADTGKGGLSPLPPRVEDLGQLSQWLTGAGGLCSSPTPRVLTFPVVGTGSAEVHSVLGEATAGAQLAHARVQVVSVAVAHLVVVGLPVVSVVQL